MERRGCSGPACCSQTSTNKRTFQRVFPPRNLPSVIEPPLIQEALRRHIGDAARALRSPTLSDEAIHRARKDLKIARAHLRLLRPAIPKAAYRRENAALRDAARPLSGVRDARVLLDTLDKLAADELHTARKTLVLKLRNVLEQARQSALSETTAGGVAEASAAALDAAWKRIDGWRMEAAGPSAVRRGAKRIYRNARKAFHSARGDSDPEALHAWRKHMKYLRAAVEVLPSPDAAKLVKKVDALAAKLGDEHDLVVLQNQVATMHSRSSGARVSLLSEIAERRAKLQAGAFKLGRRLLKPKPDKFVKKIVSHTTRAR